MGEINAVHCKRSLFFYTWATSFLTFLSLFWLNHSYLLTYIRLQQEGNLMSKAGHLLIKGKIDFLSFIPLFLKLAVVFGWFGWCCLTHYFLISGAFRYAHLQVGDSCLFKSKLNLKRGYNLESELWRGGLRLKLVWLSLSFSNWGAIVVRQTKGFYQRLLM